MTKTLQTTVDDDVHAAFSEWADEEYGSKASALRDFAESAPKGESIHSQTTNDDLMDKLEDIEGSTGWHGGYQTKSNSNGSETDTEDTDLLENYDPDVDAEDLPDDLTPVADDAHCISKDILNDVVDLWDDSEDVFSMPAINPLHVSSDYRPQGGSAPVALGISILKHQQPDKAQTRHIWSALTDEHEGLDYGTQYVRDNELQKRIAQSLVDDPTSDSSTGAYRISRETVIDLVQYLNDRARAKFEEGPTCDTVKDVDTMMKRGIRKSKTAENIMKSTGIDEIERVKPTDVNPDWRVDAERSIRMSSVQDAQDKVDAARESLSDLSEEQLPNEIDEQERKTKKKLERARDAAEDAQTTNMNHVDDADFDDIEKDAAEILEEISDLEDQVAELAEEYRSRAEERLPEIAARRARLIEQVVEWIRDNDDLSTIHAAKRDIGEYRDLVRDYDELDSEIDEDDLMNLLNMRQYEQE